MKEQSFDVRVTEVQRAGFATLTAEKAKSPKGLFLRKRWNRLSLGLAKSSLIETEEQFKVTRESVPPDSEALQVLCVRYDELMAEIKRRRRVH